MKHTIPQLHKILYKIFGFRNGEDRQSNSIQNYLQSSSTNAEDALGKWLSEHKNP